MDAIAVSMPQSENKKRFGLFPARIGMNLLHKLGIAMDVEPPQYDPTTHAPTSRTKTRVSRAKPHYEMGTIQFNGKLVNAPVKALPGAPIYLEVQPFDRLDPAEQSAAKWICTHPECAGTRFDSKDELVRSHDDSRILAAEAAQAPDGRPHMFYGVVEIPVDAEKKKKDPSAKPTIMLVSDEE